MGTNLLTRAGDRDKTDSTAGKFLQHPAYGPPRATTIDVIEPAFTALPPGVASPVELPGDWFVAQVLFQQERRVARALLDEGAGYFVPLRETRQKDRRARRMVPLFPGYVFFCAMPKHDAYAALKRAGSYNTIDVCDQGRLVKELAQIHLAMENGFRLDSYPHVADGTRCRITRGPLQGSECLVIDRNSKDVVLLEVKILGQKIEVENVSIEDLEPL